MEHFTPPASVGLVVGITSMTGLSLAEALKRHSTPGAPWTVYGAARQPPPSWFPSSTVDSYIQFDALDSINTRHILSPFSSTITHVFWLARAKCDTEEDNIAVNSAMLANVLDALTADPTTTRLRHVTIQTGTKHYMGPFVDPANVSQIAPISLPFREDTPRLPVPLFYYALEDLVASYKKLTWSIHRSSIILGASSRSIHNMLLILSVYAVICQREKSPFLFPGSMYTWEHFCDASDADVLAEQHIWAVTTPESENQAFNCTNGDVFTWRSFWRVLSDEFELEFVPREVEGCGDDNWVGRMKGKGAVWDAIVAENGLCETRLEDIACFDVAFAVLNFGFQHVCSMNKSREFGFHGCVDSLKSVRRWIQRSREMNIIPKRDSTSPFRGLLESSTT